MPPKGWPKVTVPCVPQLEDTSYLEDPTAPLTMLSEAADTHWSEGLDYELTPLPPEMDPHDLFGGS